MAGTKRKVDASRSSSSQNTAASENSNQGYARVTARRGTRIRITTSRANPTLPEESNSQEAPRAASKSEPTVEEHAGASQEPRSKRQKVVPTTETPKPTRSSARIKTRANSVSSVESHPHLSSQPSTEEASSSGNFPRNKSKTVTRKNSSRYTAVAEQPSVDSVDSKRSSEHDDLILDKNFSFSSINAPDQKLTETTSETSPSKFLRGRRSQVEDTDQGGVTEVPGSSFDLKEPKHEDDETVRKLSNDGLAYTIEDSEDSQNLQANSSAKPLPAESSTVSQNNEDVDNAALNQDETKFTSNSRGRGSRGRNSGRARGNRGRGRGAARGGAPVRGSNRGRGRGGRGGGKGGRRGEDDSDFEFERSPSPGPGSQKLLDRQKELKQSWKRLAATQRLVLNVLAGRTQNRLARDKHVFRKAPEYEEVQAELDLALEQRLEILLNEYNLRIGEANTLLEAEKTIIQERYQANASHIKEELFYAAQGDYMNLVEGVKYAEDDEHTEPDLDRPEPTEVADGDQKSSDTNYKPVFLYRDEPRFKRGYNSKYMREPSGAAASDLGKSGWDDFIQRVKMQEISQESIPTGPDPIQALLQAVDAVTEAKSGAQEGFPEALFALADAASSVQPISVPAVVNQPQPSQTTAELPSFLFPRTQTRPFFPTSHTLPDPFTSGGGPPQLPPPPGVQFTRPGAFPGFLPGHQSPHQPPPQYQHAPPPYYFPPPPAPPPSSNSQRNQRY
ncbi:hypothetical protein BGW36DRAFT_356700 [Talaromyces proteolyticus]|uniref:Uncharacterized protein n=1 Tax=Talaromyces proteolyticus TaxID=1131652 RepID=A0AAD4Q4C5_9EURO|nr:uncharacterized protein BGW36DRAFT_356700 [Talaromyces proteolyticus]KAH8702591.1 hypothetical protein BGW36DRAFT_356700 [Talaromyces proteolyticus]